MLQNCQPHKSVCYEPDWQVNRFDNTNSCQSKLAAAAQQTPGSRTVYPLLINLLSGQHTARTRQCPIKAPGQRPHRSHGRLKIVAHLPVMLLNPQLWTKMPIVFAVLLLQGLPTGMLLERHAICQLRTNTATSWP